jgi:hypothetical protein
MIDVNLKTRMIISTIIVGLTLIINLLANYHRLWFTVGAFIGLFGYQFIDYFIYKLRHKN